MIDSNYFDAKLKDFKKGDNKDFRLKQNLSFGEADLSQLGRLRKQLVYAAENFKRGQNLSPVQILRTSKDMNEQLKLAHKVVHLVDRAFRKLCVTLLRNNAEKRKSSFAKKRVFCKKNLDQKFLQTTYVN